MFGRLAYYILKSFKINSALNLSGAIFFYLRQNRDIFKATFSPITSFAFSLSAECI